MSRCLCLLGTLLLTTLVAACGTSGGASTAQPKMGGTQQAAGQPLPPGHQGPCTPENADKPRPTGKARLVIATGGTGGVYFPFGGGLARIISAKLPRTEMTAEVTGGSVDNMKLIYANEADIAMTTVDSAYDGFIGSGIYEDTGPIPACTMAVLYQSFQHVVALDGSGINRVADMRGKRFSVGSAGSSTEGAADRVLEAGGLDPRRDIGRDNLSVAESVAAMKDRKIDAFFWIGGLPTAAVTDLVSTPGLKVKFVPTDDVIQLMRDRYGPVYNEFTIPRTAYAGMEADVPGIGIGNILFTNANMNHDLIYDLTRTIFENLPDVQAIHPEARRLSVEGAVSESPLPFHPGSITYYREKGVWSR
jgi:uncharacterized protein